ncbi:MAG: flavodoxin family protein [Ilumatobacter sp.]|nr:flavodoxin family protein [Ilumatobacter sp.]
MRVLVVYESMFGNTHTVAERIGAGMGAGADVSVLRVGEVFGRELDDVDLVVVGGPTHVHGMSRTMTRASAAEQAAKDVELDLEPDAEGPGAREWLDGLGHVDGVRAAAFDTRADAPEIITGHASHGIAKRLRKHGFELVAEPESFLVDKQNHLVDGEDVRAAEWGEAVAAAATMV